MNQFELELRRIDAEIETLQRVRERLASLVALHSTGLDDPAEDRSPKAAPREQRGFDPNMPSGAIRKVLKTLAMIGPASHAAITRHSGKTGSTLQTALTMYGLKDQETGLWTLNELGKSILDQLSPSQPSESQNEESHETTK